MAEIRMDSEGWQAVIAEAFTFENAARLARAYAAYLLEQGGRRVVVGYDTRFLSPRFAERVAGVLSAEGLEVYLAKTSLPAPVLSFAVRHLEADGGVMVTGGGRPAEYLGLAFRDREGASLAPEALAVVGERVQPTALEREGTYQTFDLRRPYYQALLAHLDRESLGAYEGVLYHESLGGATGGWVSGFVKEAGLRLELRELHAVPDVLFYGVVPVPEAKSLFTATTLLRAEQDPTFAVVHDGDGSRLGVVLAGGRLLSAEEVFALLLYHLHQKGLRGRVVSGFGEGGVLGRLAGRLGLEFETASSPTEVLRARGALLAGEPSGRFCFGPHLPQSDGLLAGLLLLEMVAQSGRSLGQQLEEMGLSASPRG
ncbi:MAG: phosphoglucomutase/phosphomannomutase family protein [Meiothermus sp.]|uniref:phosphoglucomutase/phosphomannomutase family protein n=1 Tax=Meiothermus sp. TaxID=1955249 RepID=UPI0025DFD896|nr:phosphoglucomutase/phosphomannomutase family protein [Meiothermus sp.]MCS7195503.1 phosphoglucomutase/phosphomannomutase family protein [Meiothermus sp.]MDW8090431.1 phosphoglucomutase/phosphomannomutase family protein [Meiothermus sp.]